MALPPPVQQPLRSRTPRHRRAHPGHADGPDHLADQVGEVDVRHPAELLAGLGRVAEQGLDLGRAETAGVDGDDAVASGGVGSLLPRGEKGRG